MAKFTPVQTGLLQRKCACGQHTIAGGECEECRRKHIEASLVGAQSLQRRSADAEPTAVPPIMYDVLRSPGQPLDPATRAFFEPRFGHDFSQVRVHTDAKAAESAKAAHALAYTVGRNVVFGVGQYAHGTSPGRRLTAHELTHTIQQGFWPPTIPRHLEITSHADAAEREADSAENALMADKLVNVISTGTLQIARNGPVPTTPKPGPPSPASPKRHACVSKERIPDEQTGATFQQGQVNDYFRMNVDWDGKGPGCDCKCGEYRQFVKGYMKVNGRKQAKPLWGAALLEEGVYHEDGDGKTRYGHRGEPETSIDKFIPDRASGCSYRGIDTPGIQASPGIRLDMLLNFKGQTYDACANTFGEIHEWKSEFNGDIP